jgi:hypothetical protein
MANYPYPAKPHITDNDPNRPRKSELPTWDHQNLRSEIRDQGTPAGFGDQV